MLGSFIIPKTIKFRLYNIVLLVSNFYLNIKWFCNFFRIILKNVLKLIDYTINFSNNLLIAYDLHYRTTSRFTKTRARFKGRFGPRLGRRLFLRYEPNCYLYMNCFSYRQHLQEEIPTDFGLAKILKNCFLYNQNKLTIYSTTGIGTPLFVQGSIINMLFPQYLYNTNNEGNEGQHIKNTAFIIIDYYSISKVTNYFLISFIRNSFIFILHKAIIFKPITGTINITVSNVYLYLRMCLIYLTLFILFLTLFYF